MKILLYGGKGWIGTLFREWMYQEHPEVNIVVGKARCDNIEEVLNELEKFRPTHCFAIIGRTSGENINNIDYLEGAGKLEENLRDNLFSQLVLFQACRNQMNVHLTLMGTGCIFSYTHDSEAFDYEFKEEDKPNFFGSSYSVVKGFTDRIFNELFVGEALYLRIRMPISYQQNSRNFLNKIIGYPKIYSTINSMTVLEDVFPLWYEWMMEEEVGVKNVVNPGVMNHREILDLYEKLVDPLHSCEYVNEEEHDFLVKAKRSKNVLDSSTTTTHNVPELCDSIKNIFNYWNKNKNHTK